MNAKTKQWLKKENKQKRRKEIDEEKGRSERYEIAKGGEEGEEGSGRRV
jgi:hypothetical protein